MLVNESKEHQDLVQRLVLRSSLIETLRLFETFGKEEKEEERKEGEEEKKIKKKNKKRTDKAKESKGSKKTKGAKGTKETQPYSSFLSEGRKVLETLNKELDGKVTLFRVGRERNADSSD